MVIYDSIGTTYTATRRPDARVGAAITAALGDAGTVVNVGAGAGSYEPSRTVLAVEPSQVMITQRPAGSAPAVRAYAEALPIADNAVDASMAVLTIHHWTDLIAGIHELRRVARRRVAIFTWDQRVTQDFWLVREYLPAEAARFDQSRAIPIERIVDLLGGASVHTVPVPHDCTDGFAAAYWRRPEAYLDPVVRAGISMLAQPGEAVVGPGMRRLAADLSSGAWHERHAELLRSDELDGGYRLIVSDQSGHSG